MTIIAPRKCQRHQPDSACHALSGKLFNSSKRGDVCGTLPCSLSTASTFLTGATARGPAILKELYSSLHTSSSWDAPQQSIMCIAVLMLHEARYHVVQGCSRDCCTPTGRPAESLWRGRSAYPRALPKLTHVHHSARIWKTCRNHLMMKSERGEDWD